MQLPICQFNGLFVFGELGYCLFLLLCKLLWQQHGEVNVKITGAVLIGSVYTSSTEYEFVTLLRANGHTCFYLTRQRRYAYTPAQYRGRERDWADHVNITTLPVKHRMLLHSNLHVQITRRPITHSSLTFARHLQSFLIIHSLWHR